jgi:hypothetical protein
MNKDDLSNFFSQVSKEKKKRQEEIDSIVSDSFDSFFLNPLREEVSKSKKNKKVVEVAETITETITESDKVEIKKETLMERSLGLLAEPSETKTQDPLTPLDQNFVTFDQLQKHYNKFLSRIQQQLSTLGGGGETNLTYMDVPVTYVTSSTYSVTHKDYYIGVNYAGAVTITLPYADREGKKFVVKDELGEASMGANRYITILPSGSDLIDSRDRAILAYDYGSLTFIWRGNSWRVV